MTLRQIGIASSVIASEAKQSRAAYDALEIMSDRAICLRDFNLFRFFPVALLVKG